MKNDNYTTTAYTVSIDLPTSQNDVFNCITDLSKWWPEDFIGEKIELDAEFILKTGEGHISKNRVIEYVPGKKLVWLTTGSERQSDGFDWSGTKFIFELTPRDDQTGLRFTYDGVVLRNEAGKLAQICDMCIKERLYGFVVCYRATIEVTNPRQEIFRRITGDVAKWWGGNDFSGSSTNTNDEFIIHHPGAHYSKQKLVEVIPDKKVVWLVTESKLDWLKRHDEWTGTKMVFEISAGSNSNLLHFTHEGLVPEREGYARCSAGWDMVIKDWLHTLIMHGVGHF